MFTDHVISAQEHAAWFARILQDPTYKYWIIVCDGEDVGVANLYGIDVLNRHCYWGFYVGEPKVNMRNGSVGTRVEFAVLNHVFEDMKFEKLSCESLALNRGVIAMHRRFGFAQEGFFRRQVWKQGRFHDVVRMAILREEWQALRPRFQRMLTEAADQLQQTE
jgi:UDP-4-amino-4,6-dideoxy-N-acetyl-beta-L-altrosamine N-acetyltransferase